MQKSIEKYDEDDIKVLVDDLERGVTFERFGDMEPDIFSANETMRTAARLIQYLMDN